MPGYKEKIGHEDISRRHVSRRSRFNGYTTSTTRASQLPLELTQEFYPNAMPGFIEGASHEDILRSYSPMSRPGRFYDYTIPTTYVAQFPLENMSNFQADVQEDLPKRSEWIDLNKVKGWISFCDSHHGFHCQSDIPASNLPFSLPALLIDIDANCLCTVDESSSVLYAAMSYVWGQPSGEEVLQTMQDNLSTFLQHDAFSRADVRARIPDDIHVAMYMTRALGLKYLWCDRFCIIQDDKNVKAKQIANMASIYAHSTVTIVCTVHTPRGLDFKQGAEPRNQSNFDRYSDEKQRHHRLTESSAWSSRGWTLQEMVFSQRAIFVHEETLTWQCHCMIQDEYSKLEENPCNWRFSELARGMHFSSWPDLGEYSRLVSAYSRRFLTYEDDVLRAFSGITNTLTKTFLGGFHFGLPRLFFDTAMLWQSKCRLKRRNQESFPSWSWVGWIGEVDVKNWEMGSNYVLSASARGSAKHSGYSNATRTYFHVVPTVQWMAVSLKRERHLDTSLSSSSEQQVSLQDFIDDESSVRGSIDDKKTHQFQWRKSGVHWSHPCDRLRKFRYPVPVASDFSFSVAEIPPSSSHLQAATTTARLWCVVESASKEDGTFEQLGSHATDINLGEEYSYAKANIYWSSKDQRSFPIGVLQSDGQDIGDSAASKGQDFCDFVAISEVCALDTLEYVNVLWVEKVGDVSYRRGLGYVYKKAWFKRARQENVTLG